MQEHGHRPERLQPMLGGGMALLGAGIPPRQCWEVSGCVLACMMCDDEAGFAKVVAGCGSASSAR